jgi:predicted Rossmann-fold nucleotide-binding protein
MVFEELNRRDDKNSLQLPQREDFSLLEHFMWQSEKIISRMALSSAHERGLALFTSARDFPGHEEFLEPLDKLIGQLAQTRLSRVITGGGPHLLKAASDTALRHNLASLEVRMDFPWEPGELRLPQMDLQNQLSVITCPSLDMRIQVMSAFSDIVLVLPGGVGSLYEAAAFLQRYQLEYLFRKGEESNGTDCGHLVAPLPRCRYAGNALPLIMVFEDAWEGLISLVETMNNHKRVDRSELEWFVPIKSLDEALIYCKTYLALADQ